MAVAMLIQLYRPYSYCSGQTRIQIREMLAVCRLVCELHLTFNTRAQSQPHYQSAPERRSASAATNAACICPAFDPTPFLALRSINVSAQRVERAMVRMHESLCAALPAGTQSAIMLLDLRASSGNLTLLMTRGPVTIHQLVLSLSSDCLKVRFSAMTHSPSAGGSRYMSRPLRLSS